MYKLLTFILLLFSFALKSQTVINTEELRFANADQKFLGLLDFDFGMTENKAGRFVKPRASMRLEYQREKFKIIALGGYSQNRFSQPNISNTRPRNFDNRAFAHLRFNKTLSEKIVWELFSQAQFDEIQEIDQRILIGTGPRFKLLGTDTSFAYAGILYMYEYEETSAGLIDINKDHRLSTYLSATIRFNQFVGFSNTTYFQPRLDQLSDFRVSTVSQLIAQLSKKISFDIGLELIYDSRPPESVPVRMYNFSSGLAYRFK